MDPTTPNIDLINLILNGVSTGGLVGALTLAVMAFARGWVFASAIVDELRTQIRELTAALKSANDGMERMAEAWEARNKMEQDRDRDDRLLERLRAEKGNK